MITADTLTYRYAAFLALLLNALATALLISSIDTIGYIWSFGPFVAVCNLASYVVLFGAIRHPQEVRHGEYAPVR